jgi:hypothetical protein
MITRIAMAALVLSLLGAGAYAVTTEGEAVSRTTVIEKNQVWPVKGLISMQPCALAACQEV